MAGKFRRKLIRSIGLAAMLSLAGLLEQNPSWAEVKTARLAKQFGISYLPLTVMQEEQLFEKQAAALGLELKTEWLRFTGGIGMNDALLSGNLDFASGGVGPMLTIWGRTQKNIAVKAVASLNAMPLYLVTTNPNVKTIKDFTEKDKIALPAVKTSIQALTLQMAAEKVFGDGQQSKLDTLTISMGHPDAQLALLGGLSEITAHFGSAPFQEIELKDSRARKVLDSYEVLGGAHTFNLVWTSTTFAEANPKIMQAFLAALEQAEERIRSDPVGVAALWLKAENSKMAQSEAEAIIRAPHNQWTTTPKKMMQFLTYMNRVGLVSAKANDWRELFFPAIHNLPGD